jgi:Cdc6-like AAA superfamily ATPase
MNPFDPGSPADESLFSGRKSELKEAGESFDRTFRNRPDHILFYGDRGIGKTSIIHYLQHHYQAKGALFVFCGLGECKSMDDVVEQFMIRFSRQLTATNSASAISKRVMDVLSSFKGVTIGPLGVAFESKEDVRQITPHFSYLLSSCWSNIESDFKCLVVVFDEADKLKEGQASDEFAKEFAFALRNAIEELDRQRVGHVKFLMSAIPEVRQKLENYHESLLRSLRIIELGRFDAATVQELLEKGIDASGGGIKYDRAFLTGAMRYSDGIPYHVQAILHDAFAADTCIARLRGPSEEVESSGSPPHALGGGEWRCFAGRIGLGY